MSVCDSLVDRPRATNTGGFDLGRGAKRHHKNPRGVAPGPGRRMLCSLDMIDLEIAWLSPAVEPERVTLPDHQSERPRLT